MKREKRAWIYDFGILVVGALSSWFFDSWWQLSGAICAWIFFTVILIIKRPRAFYLWLLEH